MTADPKEIRDTLSLLFSGGAVVELRALADGGVHSGYFTDHDVMAERVAAMNRFTDVHGCYVTLNEVNPALLSRRANRVKQRLSRSDATTADADIIRRRWLPIDFDPVRPSGVSATDVEHAAALERAEDVADWLTERGFPEPVLADSGNGAHLLYRIDLPNDGEATRLVKGCLTVLDATVAEEICGIALKRRDHYFFFDREAYRRWNGSVVVWLEPAPPGGDGTGGDGGEQPPTNGGGGVGGMAAILQQHGGTCRHDKTGVFQPNGTDLRENRETLLQEKKILRKNETPQHLDVSHTDAGSGGCALADSSSKIASDAILAGEVEQSNILARYDGGTSHSLLHPAVHAANVGASRVCDTEHVSGIIPLPGLLTPNEFFRTAKDMGNCSVCGEGRIAWWSEKERTGICERCYTRFLREENWGKGVG